MPWCENVYRMCGNAPPFITGAGLLPGFLTFLGLLSVAVSLRVFMVKRKVYMIFVALASGLMVLLISGSWILNPVGLTFFGTVAYTPLYGAYVTVLSVLIVSEMVFLQIVTTAEKQLSLGMA